jgi:hypothetical protein
MSDYKVILRGISHKVPFSFCIRRDMKNGTVNHGIQRSLGSF